MVLEIDVWSDIACPWCWVGKRSLDAALARFDGEATVRWRAFELNPDAPNKAPEQVDYAERLAAKYRTSKEEAQGFIDRMVNAGRGRGVELRFDRIRPSNTFNAHRLLALARTHGRQAEVGEALFSAYLHEGRSISDPETLADVGERQGLDPGDITALLRGEAYVEQVRGDEAMARQYGISSVPCFVLLDKRVAVSGAQPPEVLLEMFEQAGSGGGSEA
ncbi:MAG: DsbA family oxidoreductase [Pseudomonadota bacterium]